MHRFLSCALISLGAAVALPALAGTVPESTTGSLSTPTIVPVVSPNSYTYQVTISNKGQTIQKFDLIRVESGQQQRVAVFTRTAYIKGRAVRTDSKGRSTRWIIPGVADQNFEGTLSQNDGRATFKFHTVWTNLSTWHGSMKSGMTVQIPEVTKVDTSVNFTLGEGQSIGYPIPASKDDSLVVTIKRLSDTQAMASL